VKDQVYIQSSLFVQRLFKNLEQHLEEILWWISTGTLAALKGSKLNSDNLY